MARRKKSTPPGATETLVAGELGDRLATVYLTALLVSSVVCFSPLLKYFFAQDDFTLMLAAWRDGWGAVAQYFDQEPGMFRPLTKVVYFGGMYNVFGLNSLPYHLASISVHLANTLLVFSLLRRLLKSDAAALVSATLFALSVAFFHVIAWISCIQQLLGLLFMLSALIWGLDHLRTGLRRDKWFSLGAYVLALLSNEQTFGVPVVLVAYAWLFPGSPRNGANRKEALQRYAGHLAVLAVYLLFMGVWKTLPRTGAYAFSYGTNTVVNLVTYIGWSLQFGVKLPALMQVDRVWWSITHIIFLLVSAFLMARGRWRDLVFGLLIFFAAISPALLLTGHTFYLHTYIPSLGVLYLLGVVVDDVLAVPYMRKRGVILIMMGIVLAAMTFVSFHMVRKNEHLMLYENINTLRSFVLRRALVAQTMHDQISDRKPFGENIQKVYLVYLREEGRSEARWNKDNVVAATGWGSMLPLLYEKPQLQTEFKVMGDAVKRNELVDSDVYFFDDFGNCFGPDPEELD